MRALVPLLWLAGLVQVAIASANLFLPAKLKYRDNLARVSPIIRQIFVVHSVYIVGVVLLFAVLTFGFAGELASGRGLGRFLAAAISVFLRQAFFWGASGSVFLTCCFFSRR